MSKKPTKIVQKKKGYETQKYVSRKRRCSKLCLQIQRNTKFQETKICLAVYTKKKTEPKFDSYFLSYKYRLLRGFLLEKKKEKEKKIQSQESYKYDVLEK